MATTVAVALAVKPDQTSIKKTEKAIVGGMTNAFVGVEKSAKKVANSISKGFELKKVDTELKQTTVDMDKLGQSTQQAVLSAKELEDQFGRVSRQTAALGDVESGARTLGGAVGGIGATVGGGAAAGEIEKTVAALSEIPAAFEAIPKLAQSLGSVAVRFSSMIPVVSGIVPPLGAAIAGMTGMSVATSTMVVAAIPFVAIGAAVAAVFFLLARSHNKAKEKAEAYREAIEAQADTFATFSQALTSGDLEGATQQLVSLEQELAAERQKRAFAAQAAAQATGKTQDELNDAVKEYEQNIDTLAGQLSTARETIQDYGVSIASLDRRTESAKDAEDELTSERDRAISAIDQLSAQESKLISDRAQKQTRAAEDQAVSDTRAAEDQAELASQQRDKLSQIERDGNKKISQSAADGKKDLLKIQESGEKALVDEAADFVKRQDEIQNDFAQADIERIEKHNDAKLKAEQDFENAEFDAILNNDIVGAMQAQRRFEEEERTRDADFNKLQAKEMADTQLRLQTLQRESQDRLTAIEAQNRLEIAASERTTKEKIANERRALNESITNERKAQAEQEKQRRKQEKRAAEDQALREEREQEAFQARLKEIQDKKSAEQQALQAVTQTLATTAQAAIQVAGNAAQAMIQAVGNLAQQAFAAASNAAKTGQQSTIKRASGGRVTAGNMFQVNDASNRRKEFFRPDISGRIIPLQDNIAGGGGGGRSVILKPIINLSVGDIASPQDVVTAVRNGIMQMAQTDLQATADALAGS